MSILTQPTEAAMNDLTQNLVFIPGLMCDAHAWGALAHGVQSPHGLIRPQIFDPGSSDSLSGMARRLLADSSSKFALAGHSMGGRIALEVMRQAPDRVTRLALLDSGATALPVGDAGAREVAGRMRLVEIARSEGVEAMAREWVRGMVAPHRLSDTSLIEGIVQMFARRTAATFAAQIHALIHRREACDVLANVRVPTMVLTGGHDAWANVAQHQAMFDLIPGPKELCVIPDSGHMTALEAPEAMGAALARWLAM